VQSLNHIYLPLNKLELLSMLYYLKDSKLVLSKHSSWIVLLLKSSLKFTRESFLNIMLLLNIWHLVFALLWKLDKKMLSKLSETFAVLMTLKLHKHLDKIQLDHNLELIGLEMLFIALIFLKMEFWKLNIFSIFSNKSEI